jgi:hypothetical protein
MIVVLRTVYIIPAPSLATQVPVGCPSTDSFRSIIIPIEHTEPYAPAQQDLHKRRKTRKQEAKDPERLHLSHSYKFEISKNCRYILYSGTTELKPPSYSDSEPLVTSLAVFSLNRSENSCYFLSNLGGNGSQMSFKASSFDPDLPLVLSYSRSFIRGPNIILWSFISNDSRLPNSKPPLRSRIAGFPSDIMTSSWPTVLGVDSLNFSMCGTQVVVKFCGQYLPEVRSLQPDPVYQWTLDNHKTRSEDHVYSQMQSPGQTKASCQNESAMRLHSASLELG